MTNENVLSEQIKGSLEQALQAAADEADVSYLNVMQALVEDKADKYIKTAGVCPCPRCRIDVIALTLSKLPSKYVVLSQLMDACEIVKKHPRHGTEDEPSRGIAFVR